ncbi:hypothetical protein RHGRI_001078 [Rhododendron griersonianum]|uniref:SWIM-type domain-containing protein n=1 Tax=Rhododendron griersonianum TaxID=479676 RepID=A0AAV6LJT0_9ERIC|nr:hypothetical protein RHGRI_001078 [Rhododendron griersonianum]
MAASVLLMCKYGEVTLVVMVTKGFGFNDFVQSICNKWENLASSKFGLLYAVADHHSCILDNDEDFGCMIALAAAYGVNCIDVSVGIISSSVIECGKSLARQNGECGGSFEYGECSSLVGEEEDPLEKFCPHYETARLSAGWVNLISHVGQEFRGGVVEFRNCLSKYAIEVGFNFKYLKNDQTRVTAECSKKLNGCTWFIHATLERSNQFFVVRELHKEHNCVGIFFSSKNPRMTSKNVSKEIFEEIRSNPSYAPIEALRHFEKRYGSMIGYHHAWLGVEMANKELFGDFELSFDKLRWYAAEVKEKNPGTVMDVEYCIETGRFTRFFLAFDACIRGFNYYRPILALDVNMFNDVAHAPTVLTFKKALDELCIVGGASVKNFVESLPVENCANAYFKGKRYGEMTSNVVESFNNQILKFRHLPICDLVDKVRVLLMEQMCERKQLSSKWNSSVCPVMDKKLVDRFDKGRTWHVAAASDDIFEVYSLPTVVVDLKRMTCTCCRWELHCFPCVHAVTVIQKTERQLCNYINPYYTIAAFQLSYEIAINPIPTLGAPVVTKEFAIILPPKTRRPCGGLKLREYDQGVRK